MKKICVFCSSSSAVSEKYFQIAKKLGEIIALNNYELVYGGANVGLMKAISDAVINNNGKVIGVIPEVIYNKGLANKNLTQLIVTKNMSARKQKMNELSDAFIALPGGFGTLEELLEVITLKQLEEHLKPIVILNYEDFYTNLFKQFDVFYNSKFSKNIYRNLYFISTKVDDIINYINNYKEKKIDSKWFDVSKKAFEKN